jgi:hypothetical protein
VQSDPGETVRETIVRVVVSNRSRSCASLFHTDGSLIQHLDEKIAVLTVHRYSAGADPVSAGRFAVGDTSRRAGEVATGGLRAGCATDVASATSGSVTLDAVADGARGSIDVAFGDGSALRGAFTASQCAPPSPLSPGQLAICN